MIYAVDFDGTLCENQYPDIGEPNKILINFLKKVKDEGNEIILYTMREGDVLDKAVEWCKTYGLEFDAVNDNLLRMQQFFKNNPRKIFANVYIDDHNIKGDLANMLPYVEESELENPFNDTRFGG